MEASYPVDRDTAIKSSMRWLRGKTKDDHCNQLWRVSTMRVEMTMMMVMMRMMSVMAACEAKAMISATNVEFCYYFAYFSLDWLCL